MVTVIATGLVLHIKLYNFTIKLHFMAVLCCVCMFRKGYLGVGLVLGVTCVSTIPNPIFKSNSKHNGNPVLFIQDLTLSICVLTQPWSTLSLTNIHTVKLYSLCIAIARSARNYVTANKLIIIIEQKGWGEGEYTTVIRRRTVIEEYC